MAKLILEHNPSLTKEKLKDILEQHFSQKGYKVGFSSLLGKDIYIKKNAWVGATVTLKQKSDKTFLRIYGEAPSFEVRLLFYGIIPLFILLPKWNKLVKETKDFIISENCALNVID